MDLNVVEGNLNKDEIFTILNTNARSLCPKMSSLIDNLRQLQCQIGVVTETWLSDGQSLDEDLDDLRTGTGYSALTLNRKPNSKEHHMEGWQSYAKIQG